METRCFSGVSSSRLRMMTVPQPNSRWEERLFNSFVHNAIQFNFILFYGEKTHSCNQLMVCQIISGERKRQSKKGSFLSVQRIVPRSSCRAMWFSSFFSDSANGCLHVFGQDAPVHVLLFYHTSREVVNSICKKAGKRNKLHKFSRRFLSKKANNF